MINWLLLRRRSLMKERYNPYKGWVTGAFYSRKFGGYGFGLTSPYMPVSPNTNYTIKLCWNNRLDAGDFGFDWGVWYDANYNVISGISGRVAATAESKPTSPATAAYVRVTVWNARKDNAYMYKTNTREYLFKGRNIK